MIYLSDSGEVP